MTTLQVLILAIVQGTCELLPISSSAHVILAEKLMGLDPTAPQMTLRLVMLHTGTMFAVIAYFWRSWVERYFDSVTSFWALAKLITVATTFTGVIGIALMLFIERVALSGSAHAEVEHLFGNPYVIAAGLATVGVMIILSARHEMNADRHQPIGTYGAAWIGAVQGLCLPFRGFSRSGDTISTALFFGLEKRRVAGFSFALAVVLTPAIIAKEGYRLLKANDGTLAVATGFFDLVWSSLLGMTFSGNLETRVLRTRSSPNWLGLLERPAHAGTFRGVFLTTLKKGNEHEQICGSIACYLALSIPPGMGAEESVSDVARAGG